MRLTISNDDVLDSSIFGDNNQPLYRVSTNSDNPFNHTTTIRDVNCSDPNTELHLATITRNTTGSDTIRFEGHESVDANDMLSRRWFSTSRIFTGPDNCCYKWKIKKSDLWLKRQDTGDVLARYYKQSLGHTQPEHPPYLEVILPLDNTMLHYVVVTFIYVEMLWRRLQQSRRR